MSATERVRELLDERGVGWWNQTDPEPQTVTMARLGEQLIEYHENVNGTMGYHVWNMCDLTPEQAIAATLGTGTCHNASKVMDEHGQARFACSECGAWIDSRMLWNPEYRNCESPWVSGCKLNFCPNCGRRIEVDA